MTKSEKREVELMESDIRLHRYLYYNKTARISDQAYDGLIERLKQLNPQSDVIVKEIGAPVPDDSGWQKATHSMRLSSLANAMSIDEFNQWVSRSMISGKVLVAEDKFDGLSVELEYDNGILSRAITRGDGKTGEDITINVKKMKYVQAQLKEKVVASIRGEIMLFKKDFDEINAEIIKNGEKPYANARNAAGGICKRFDGKYSDKLCVIVYDIVSKDVAFTYETEKMDYLSDVLGIVTANYKLLTAAGIIDLRQQYMSSLRDKLSYNIDGLVIKINNIQKQKDLGLHGNGDPKGQVAFKFDAKGVATTLNDIKLTVGRTGAIIPNAVIDPVNIDGSIIKAASIHNFDEVQRLKLGIGDQILVVKAGEIIPQIVEVIKSNGKPYQMPTQCPACGGPVEKGDGAILYCINDNCVGKEFRKVRHWIDVLKKRLSLDGIGISTIEQLYEKGMVKDPADFYKLTENDIANLDRSGDKSAKKIISGLTASKEMDLVTFLTALGIESLGETMAEVISDEYDLYELMDEVKESDLSKISGIGDSRAKDILDSLEQRRSLIEKLMQAGIKIKKASENINLVSNKLQGKSFQVTGAFSKVNPATDKSYKREEWYELVQSHGGAIGRVNKELNYLVAIKSNSNKIKKAATLGIQMISEDEFWKMIE